MAFRLTVGVQGHGFPATEKISCQSVAWRADASKPHRDKDLHSRRGSDLSLTVRQGKQRDFKRTDSVLKCNDSPKKLFFVDGTVMNRDVLR